MSGILICRIFGITLNSGPLIWRQLLWVAEFAPYRNRRWAACMSKLAIADMFQHSSYLGVVLVVAWFDGRTSSGLILYRTLVYIDECEQIKSLVRTVWNLGKTPFTRAENLRYIEFWFRARVYGQGPPSPPIGSLIEKGAGSRPSQHYGITLKAGSAQKGPLTPFLRYRSSCIHTWFSQYESSL